MKKIGNISSKFGGFVFVDRNGDGFYSPWEARTTVSSGGDYRLDGSKSALTGVLVHVGGVDAYSGKESSVYYKAPTSAKVMNVLTTVAVKAQEDMQERAIEQWSAYQALQGEALKGSGFGKSPGKNLPPKVTYMDAANKLLSAFDVGKFAIFKQDAFSMLSAGKLKAGSVKQLKALDALKLDLKLELLLDVGVSVINSIDLNPSSQYAIQEGMVQVVVDKVVSGQKIDFNEITHITDVVLAGGVAAEAFGSFEDAPFNYIYGMSAILAELMAYVDSFVDSVIAKGKGISAGDVQGMLSKLKNVFVIAHDAAIEIESAWQVGTSLDVLERYTGDSLSELLDGAGVGAGAVVSGIGRDERSMTTGDDVWIVKAGVAGDFAIQKIAVSEPILPEDEFTLVLGDGTRIEIGALGQVGMGQTALDILAESLNSQLSGVRVSAQADGLLLEYEVPAHVATPPVLYKGRLDSETKQWVSLSTFQGQVLKSGIDVVASYSPANMNGFDKLLNFSALNDHLDLPSDAVMSVGVYGNIQVDARGMVTAVTDPETGGPMSTMALEEVVDSILTAMGSSNTTAAFHMDGNTYVVQGDGLVGMQDSDILIELTGVQLQDLPSILI